MGFCTGCCNLHGVVGLLFVYSECGGMMDYFFWRGGRSHRVDKLWGRQPPRLPPPPLFLHPWKLKYLEGASNDRGRLVIGVTACDKANGCDQWKAFERGDSRKVSACFGTACDRGDSL